MDDGFQNPTIYKDFSILVVDGEYGFGNKRILPAGPLRESISLAIGRADLVVIIEPEIRKMEPIISKNKTVLTARFVPNDPDINISGARVCAFAGIGRPAKFFRTLTEMGCDLIETWSFPDHHIFTNKQIANILKIAKENDAIPITTEKDSVRLPVSARDTVQILPVTLEWNDKQVFDDIIEAVIRTKV
jgi:tetraacyldisaccharide 4'-kinase